MSKELERPWADKAMFKSEPMPEGARGPRVFLLSMTADPLGAIAAASMMYEGKVVRSLADVTHADRRHYIEQIKKTHLKAPFEFVDLHFMIEGVTRSFTHQMVRQRTAVYCQESLRFAVKENLDEETPLPPSLAGLPNDHPQVRLWRGALNRVQDTYETLVADGMPAEDARGLLPHQTTTRLHYKTNLRGLYEHLGNRLCTQAQFEWRSVAIGIVQAIREYRSTFAQEKSLIASGNTDLAESIAYAFSGDAWQQEVLADMFAPICYLTGKCEFNASFDRACSIRDRVEANHAIGRTSEKWYSPVLGTESADIGDGRKVFLGGIGAIRPEEWLADPTAARREG